MSDNPFKKLVEEEKGKKEKGKEGSALSREKNIQNFIKTTAFPVLTFLIHVFIIWYAFSISYKYYTSPQEHLDQLNFLEAVFIMMGFNLILRYLITPFKHTA